MKMSDIRVGGEYAYFGSGRVGGVYKVEVISKGHVRQVMDRDRWWVRRSASVIDGVEVLAFPYNSRHHEIADQPEFPYGATMTEQYEDTGRVLIRSRDITMLWDDFLEYKERCTQSAALVEEQRLERVADAQAQIDSLGPELEPFFAVGYDGESTVNPRSVEELISTLRLVTSR